MQTNLFNNGIQVLPMDDAQVEYISSWLKPELADRLFTQLQQEIAWQEGHIKLFGKMRKIPRLQAWYGDPQTAYEYSGVKMQPLQWTHNLLTLKKMCEAHCDTEFNSVLANLYRDGADSMGFHADDEPELGTQPIIASLSLGQSRNFDLAHKRSKEKHRIVLQHGSLLVMAGDTQTHWQHGINKSKKPHGPRINLTFRCIK